MAEKKDKTAPAKTEKKAEKKVDKAEKKVDKKAEKKPREPVRAAAEEDDEEEIQLLVCSECGLLVSIDESCGCEPANLTCCGRKMIEPELASLQPGSLYRCNKCGVRVIIEEVCECTDDCDLLCCGKPMVLCED